ncbi:3-carboxy-cis,cis-muconate cycloisomerase [Agrobacterium vitis]|uniref:3-carboxy-cis,cis-muconate cycloisomerase n=1 Tax=Agrobacterium vitis TaxID=373 RepID=A0A368P0J6_AGRVI|nr:3-carboxy-cis,cis-muconate cycloisomerase [Agrobacterium vitis]KAA3511287.1 3-carboxy-cis,cis-muconate cycloisomerase [Agrobacterium vitis]KAA3527891.1 3-carboxy-cis,cis-muconate cycloisomerase [Agrobacterium vitis]MCF1478432.1 3-carboxy-cis,cis-muconate cycloisomerase [Agrobacterium vitis]MUZ96593.1 3-carboxy-cis,cis-muconate cycloisomerase [Agrobacterium vitis]MVA28554.1 3-carboxy-cis,cis-muconate cycloisomerase [Agrobacterium vitis]
MSISPFEHPFLSGLFDDEAFAALFAGQADIAAMLSFEAALAKAQGEAGVIEPGDATAIQSGLARFTADLDALKTATARDGVVIPELVAQMRKAIGGASAAKLHFGATSQDVIDTSLVLRLKMAAELLDQRLAALIAGFEQLDAAFGQNALMGHTRMQAAIPITVSDRIAAWVGPLQRHRTRLQALLGDGFALQFGGAAGTLEKLGDKGPAVRARLAELLGLEDAPQWHSQRDRIVALADLLSLISGSLGKFGQDVALLAEMGGEIQLTGGGSSSAMPHKQNPVGAETLVTLARFNAVQIAGLHQSLVHEQERSGAAWALEWLLLPQMVVATGAATKTGLQLIGAIARLGKQA